MYRNRSYKDQKQYTGNFLAYGCEHQYVAFHRKKENDYMVKVVILMVPEPKLASAS